MSVSFSLTQGLELQCLATWASTGLLDELNEKLDYSNVMLSLRDSYLAYVDGRLPMSELRKQHKTVCTLLVRAARLYPGLRSYSCTYPSWDLVPYDFHNLDQDLRVLLQAERPA